MTWQIDYDHSHILFSVRHMMISKVRGSFGSFNGTIDFDPDALAETTVEVRIDASTIDTRNEGRDQHLRSADFLNVEQYPEIVFQSTSVVQKGEDKGKLVGDLTIRGITREVVLDVSYAGTLKNPWGAQSAGFSAKTVLNRHDWGASWNVVLEAGGVLVGDQITVEIELELMKQAVEEAVSS